MPREEVFCRVVPAIFVRHLVRRVRTVEGQIHEERPIALFFDEPHGRRSEHVADVAVGLPPDAVVAEIGVEIGAALVLRVGRVAGRCQAAAVEDQRFLEAAVHGRIG